MVLGILLSILGLVVSLMALMIGMFIHFHGRFKDIDEKFDQLRKEIDAKIADVRSEMREGFKTLQQYILLERIERIDHKLSDNAKEEKKK